MTIVRRLIDPEDLAIAGAFVSIDAEGRLRVQRGYVRPEDEPQVEVEASVADSAGGNDAHAKDGTNSHNDHFADRTTASSGQTADEMAEPEEDEGLKPIPDRLLTELTAIRTVALREAVGRSPEVALLRGAARALPARLLSLHAG